MTEDEHPIRELAAQCSYLLVGVGLGLRVAQHCLDHFDAGSGEDRVERASELAWLLLPRRRIAIRDEANAVSEGPAKLPPRPEISYRGVMYSGDLLARYEPKTDVTSSLHQYVAQQ